MNQAKELLQYLFNALKIWVIVQPWEQAVRTRFGKNPTILNKGIYFKLPYIDSVFVQETRLRICDTPMLTATTKDLKTITISLSIGYSISNIEKLYNSLYHPETTIRNIAMSEVSRMIFKNSIDDVKPEHIESLAIEKLKELNYGITFEYLKITNFAV
ncbi:MAG TPA: SPFH domain-containing protein, partial [Flavobacterium sp.]|nr:SPFH domain-containing protein [Flavobacterium sp.]